MISGNNNKNVEVKKLKVLANEIDKIVKASNDENTIKIGKEAKAIITKASHLINNMEYSESGLITAMRNGDWVLFDGVESCPPNILEMIITLLDFEPSLNLYEVGEGVTFQPNQKFLKIRSMKTLESFSHTMM
ncbi:hypothetical protein TVAG_439120 [Trichomonas vaginalis G3]|uniref:ATPase dynein-related AAA domain-containing protein n=2 Tax=Trichomonas vaginalis (strain ATCC PRA-98 / G3) TaxID=412133 RepID=A2FQX9_TRIV3|nr:hypothetical protein TVAG_439120 [Trichomonas vaginalis G3]|eukprot:XP_001305614.1 hypothetical protein [Trichomonas vaginalis G3]